MCLSQCFIIVCLLTFLADSEQFQLMRKLAVNKLSQNIH